MIEASDASSPQGVNESGLTACGGAYVEGRGVALVRAEAVMGRGAAARRHLVVELEDERARDLPLVSQPDRRDPHDRLRVVRLCAVCEHHHLWILLHARRELGPKQRDDVDPLADEAGRQHVGGSVVKADTEADRSPLRLHELRHVAWEPARPFFISGIDTVARGKGGALGQRVVVRGRL